MPVTYGEEDGPILIPHSDASGLIKQVRQKWTAQIGCSLGFHIELSRSEVMRNCNEATATSILKLRIFQEYITCPAHRSCVQVSSQTMNTKHTPSGQARLRRFQFLDSSAHGHTAPTCSNSSLSSATWCLRVTSKALIWVLLNFLAGTFRSKRRSISAKVLPEGSGSRK